jgi:hypothetical protein
MEEQPQKATFVKMVTPPREVESQARQIKADIDRKLKKLELPSGPAWINGRWW